MEACTPDASVAHSHADAILMLSNNCDGDIHVRRCFGREVAIVPYRRPGFQLITRVINDLVAGLQITKYFGGVIPGQAFFNINQHGFSLFNSNHILAFC